MLDGVYVPDPLSDRPTFLAVVSPTDDPIQHLIEQVAQRLIAQLEGCGVLDDTQSDSLAEKAPLLAGITAASIQAMVATGARAGRRLRRLLVDPAEGIRTAPLCFSCRGFSLHAATHSPRTPAATGRRPDQLCAEETLGRWYNPHRAVGA